MPVIINGCLMQQLMWSNLDIVLISGEKVLTLNMSLK